MANSPFDFVKDLTINKRPWDSLDKADQKAYTVFMTNKHLSMNKDYIEAVNYMQIYYNVPKEVMYKVYLELLPQEDRYSKYIKKRSDGLNKDLLKVIAQHYQISCKEAKDYLRKMNKDEIGSFLIRTGMLEKDVKKLLK